MSKADIPPPTPTPPPLAPLAGFLSYLVPGLGQISQGRVGKGLLFMVGLLGMFFLGQAMGQWRNVYIPIPKEMQGPGVSRNPISGIMLRWHYAGQFFIGVAAWPALWQFYEKPMPDSQFWRDYQRGPRDEWEEQDMNKLLVNSDKTPDLGWVYTVIAGMLNILVIYDAFAGPLFVSGAGREEPVEQPEGVTS
jgi:hypothetical protein